MRAEQDLQGMQERLRNEQQAINQLTAVAEHLRQELRRAQMRCASLEAEVFGLRELMQKRRSMLRVIPGGKSSMDIGR